MPGAQRYTLNTFSGSADTLRVMRQQTWGDRGERSLVVRELTEAVTKQLWPKAYLSEILAVRNFAAVYLRYVNDPLHVELVRDPQNIAEKVLTKGVASVDCDEIAQMIATMCLQLGRRAEFCVVGFGDPGEYSHVFTRIEEPKTKTWVVCDPVAGQDERAMLDRVTTYELWSLDEVTEPASQLPGGSTSGASGPRGLPLKRYAA